MEEGHTAFTSTGLRVHLYRTSVDIREMANAGKRGKSVREMVVHADGNFAYGSKEEARALRQAATVAVNEDYDRTKSTLARLGYRISERLLRGVDVEPMATTIRLRRKFEDGTVVSIEASPHDFHVTNSAVMGSGRPDFRPTDTLRDDTGYWPRKKKDGAKFYAWITKNIEIASKMRVHGPGGLKEAWKALGVDYNSH